jgi:hypothetical protein
MAKFHQWLKEHTVVPKLVEAEMVSEEHLYGGCLDFYGLVDGHLSVVDFKTGKAIYDEYFYQLAGYTRLLVERSYAVDQVTILQIGRNENEGFSTKTREDLGTEWEIFKHCLALYNLRKKK